MTKEQIKPEGFEYSAKDLSELAGLSYRQINSQDSRGQIPSKRETSSGWRKFSPRDIFVIVVCSELRKQFDISHVSLDYIKSKMLQPKANHLLAAAELLDGGLTPCLLTNLKNHFRLASSSTINEEIQIILHKNSEVEAPFILMNLSPITKRLIAYFQKTQTQSRKENP